MECGGQLPSRLGHTRPSPVVLSILADWGSAAALSGRGEFEVLLMERCVDPTPGQTTETDGSFDSTPSMETQDIGEPMLF